MGLLGYMTLIVDQGTYLSCIERRPSTCPLLISAVVTFFSRREFQPGHSAKLWTLTFVEGPPVSAMLKILLNTSDAEQRMYR